MNLTKLADAINEEIPGWKARGSDLGISVEKEIEDFDPFAPYFNYRHEWDEYDNARWIIWCLDHLEGLGCSPALCIGYGNRGYFCEVQHPEDTWPNGKFIAKVTGETRHEAVTRALAKALGVEE